jgi:hypothetical protein
MHSSCLDESLAAYKLGCLVQEVFDLKMVVIERIELAKQIIERASLSAKPQQDKTG